MKIIVFAALLICFSLKLVYSQDDDIPIDNSESWGSYDKTAISTNLKNAYPLALWLGDFNKYIPDLKEINSLSELSSGYYHINMKSYCIRPGKPVGGTGGGTAFGPLKGKKAKLINEILFKSVKHPEIEQKYVQTLIWGIIAGLSYSDYPADFRKKIAPLLTDPEKKESGIKLNDLLDLIPDDIKGQIGILNDIRSLVKEGISRYEDLERIAVPQGIPVPSSKDINIEPGQWTLFENGYYIRATPVLYSSTGLEIYKPASVNISYDAQGRITQMESTVGKIEVEYDNNDGADVITRSGGNYKINRISTVKLNGKEIDQFKDALWTIPYDNKTSMVSGYSRIFDPPVGVFEEREKASSDFIESVKKYNEKKKLTVKDSDIPALYELKQFELCVKWMADNQVLDGEDITTLIKISMDGTLNKIDDVVYKNKLTSGGEKITAPSPGGLVVMFGADGAQNIVISPEGKEDEVCPDVVLHQVSRDFLPDPFGQTVSSLQINSDRHIDEIEFELFDVSRENGRCINDKNPLYYKTDPDPDLILEAEYNPGYSIEPTGGGGFIAHGGGDVPQIVITSKDFGAYGKLKARVRIGEKWCNVAAENGGSYIKIPFDQNDNNVADKWEDDNGVSGYTADYDEDETPSGQAMNGDGLTLYEEYRGVYVLADDGTVLHVRTNPKAKEIFVIDESNIMNPVQWEGASGIKCFRLNEGLVYGSLAGTDESTEYKKLNFCSNFARGVKYAVSVVKVEGMNDPYGEGTASDRGYHSGDGPPINTKRVVIFPARIWAWISDEKEHIGANLRDYPDIDPIHYGEGVYPRSMVQRWVDMVSTPEGSNSFYEFLLSNTVIHEIGHACKIEHHGRGITPEVTFHGDPTCPIKYSNTLEFAQVYFGASSPGTVWHFCTAAPDQCMQQININDRRP